MPDRAAFFGILRVSRGKRGAKRPAIRALLRLIQQPGLSYRKGLAHLEQKKVTSPSLVRQIITFLVLFLLVLLAELGLNRYQTQKVILPQQQRTQQIRAISQYLNCLEDSMRAFGDYRWDYGDTQALMTQVSTAQTESAAFLAQIDTRLDCGSEEQYLLANASATTYNTFSGLVEDILSLLRRGEPNQAADLYYTKAEPCGAYTRQYTQQLLECTIRDSQSAFTQLGRLNDRLTRFQTIVFFLCMFSCIGMAAPLLTLLRSVRQMAAASQAIRRGELDTPDVDESRNDEIGSMARAFNEMKHAMGQQVQVLAEKNVMERALYKKQKEALELETLMEQEKLQKLRSQINPHFLFNTLNVILYTSQQEGAEKTHALIGSLGQLFRYSLASNTSLVPLSREVRIVNEFYTLNKVRFGDRINMKWEVSPEIDLTETLVPSFLIQPMVENAFRHGLAPKESGGTAVISIQAVDNALLVTISDDGVGMTADALAALQKSLETPQDTGDHIGLYNVAARLRLRGEGFGLTIASTPGAGTRVALRMPLILEESEETEDDEDPDSR